MVDNLSAFPAVWSEYKYKFSPTMVEPLVANAQVCPTFVRKFGINVAGKLVACQRVDTLEYPSFYDLTMTQQTS